MSPAVTAQDLELELAELLPARETLVAAVNPGGPGIFRVFPVYSGPGPDQLHLYHHFPLGG